MDLNNETIDDTNNVTIDDLENLVEEKKYSELKTYLFDMLSADIAELIDEVPLRDALIVYRLLPKNIAIEVFSMVEVERQSELTSLVSEEELKNIVDELFFDDMIDLIEEVPASIVKKILRNTSPNERNLINQFLKYEDDTAGSLMTIEFVDLKKNMTVSDAMNRIRTTGVNKETIYTCYVVGKEKILEGIVSLKHLVLSESDMIVEAIMTDDFIAVGTQDDQEYIADVFKKYDLLSLPVVDNEMRLVGIITIDDIVDVIEEETTEDFQIMAAMTPSDEEYMSMTPFDLARKRIIWLIALMFSATLSETIMGHYKGVTIQIVILTSMIPMLMSTGGNAGAQSSTLIIRGLTLGDIEFTDIFKVIWKEVKVGILLGLTLGILNFGRIFLFSNNIKLAITVGLTLIGTTTMAAFMGGVLPILAKKAKLDPAIMATPLISTITDATTLVIFFTIATLMFLG